MFLLRRFARVPHNPFVTRSDPNSVGLTRRLPMLSIVFLRGLRRRLQEISLPMVASFWSVNHSQLPILLRFPISLWGFRASHVRVVIRFREFPFLACNAFLLEVPLKGIRTSFGLCLNPLPIGHCARAGKYLSIF